MRRYRTPENVTLGEIHDFSYASTTLNVLPNLHPAALRSFDVVPRSDGAGGIPIRLRDARGSLHFAVWGDNAGEGLGRRIAAED
jgi:hypothetical protein